MARYMRSAGDIIDPGQMDQVIEITRYATTPDSVNTFGEDVNPPPIKTTHRAMAEYTAGSERIENDRVTSNTSVIFTIRKFKELANIQNINTSQTLTWMEEKYDIENIEYAGRKRYMKLYCKRYQG